MRLYTFAICLPTSLPLCDRSLPPTAARLSPSQTQESCDNKTTDKLTFLSIFNPTAPHRLQYPSADAGGGQELLALNSNRQAHTCNCHNKYDITSTTPYNLMLVSFIPVRFAPLFDGSWVVNHIDHSSSPRVRREPSFSHVSRTRK